MRRRRWQPAFLFVFFLFAAVFWVGEAEGNWGRWRWALEILTEIKFDPMLLDRSARWGEGGGWGEILATGE